MVHVLFACCLRKVLNSNHFVHLSFHFSVDYEATGDIQMVDQALQESWAMLTSAIGTQHNDFSASSSTQLPFSGSDRSTAELLQEWCDLSFQDDPLMEIISSFERTATSSSAS